MPLINHCELYEDCRACGECKLNERKEKEESWQEKIYQQ